MQRLVQEGRNKIAKFNWLDEKERFVIISVLDALCSCIQRRGSTSERRNSGAKSSTTTASVQGDAAADDA